MHPPEQYRQMNRPHFRTEVSETETIVMDDLEQDGKRTGYKSEFQ